MTAAAPVRCPVCQVGETVRHCPNPTCTWIVCRMCRGYGTPDAGRWQR